ncbi:MAG: hypothetical protein O3A33_00855 [Chloroflexi bacterium]|nr:hypothetical protein [Chloroflexota bacterium]
MTIHQASAGQITKTAPQSRRSPVGLSVPLAPLAVASVAVALLGFYADVLAPLAIGRALTFPSWIASTIVVAFMWAAVAVRSGYRVPIPTTLVTGGLFLVGLFIWTAMQALVSPGSISGVAATTQAIAGLTLFMVVASLVAQSHDFASLNRMAFALGTLVSGLVIFTAMFGVVFYEIGLGLLPGLLAMSLLAGFSDGNHKSPARWIGLIVIIVALSLAVTPDSLAIVAIALAIAMAAKAAMGRGHRPSSTSARLGLGLFLAFALVTGLLLFNGAFDAIQGTVFNPSALVGAESYVTHVSSSNGWFLAAVPLVLWLSFVMYASAKALWNLSIDRHSEVWTFGLVLAVIATLVLSISYQPMIWLMAAVVVGRHIRIKRIAAFRERLDLEA